MRRVLALVLSCVLSSATLGCGLTMTTGPGTPVPGQRPVCTESMAAPMRDGYAAGVGFLTILVGLLFLKGGNDETVGVPLMIGGGAVMAGSYISGGIGYFRVKKCRKAIADFETQRPR